jgi:hypothetical protein
LANAALYPMETAMTLRASAHENWECDGCQHIGKWFEWRFEGRHIVCPRCNGIHVIKVVKQNGR